MHGYNVNYKVHKPWDISTMGNEKKISQFSLFLTILRKKANLIPFKLLK